MPFRGLTRLTSPAGSRSNPLHQSVDGHIISALASKRVIPVLNGHLSTQIASSNQGKPCWAKASFAYTKTLIGLSFGLSDRASSPKRVRWRHDLSFNEDLGVDWRRKKKSQVSQLVHSETRRHGLRQIQMMIEENQMKRLYFPHSKPGLLT